MPDHLTTIPYPRVLMDDAPRTAMPASELLARAKRLRADAATIARVARVWADHETRNAQPGRRVIRRGVAANEITGTAAATLARLARAGRLVREFDPSAGDAGCYVYRPL
jgi:hypothetical protein